MKTVQIKFEEVDDEIIERDKLFNVYLLGLPRSGTSMTTHILELLGVNMVYTSEDDREKTAERFRRKYGDYHANPNGFFEITRKPFMNFLRVLETPYSGCKMIIPVRGFRYEILKSFPCKIIFMTRDVEEIRQSQMAYYRRDNVDVAFLRSALVNQRLELQKNNLDFIEVNYNELLQNKVNIIRQIKEFIKSDRDIQEAVDFVNPEKNYRFKKEELTVGL